MITQAQELASILFNYFRVIWAGADRGTGEKRKRTRKDVPSPQSLVFCLGLSYCKSVVTAAVFCPLLFAALTPAMDIAETPLRASRRNLRTMKGVALPLRRAALIAAVLICFPILLMLHSLSGVYPRCFQDCSKLLSGCQGIFTSMQR